MEFCLLLQMVKFLQYVLSERFWIFFFYFLPFKQQQQCYVKPSNKIFWSKSKVVKVWIHFKAYSKTKRCQNQSRFPNFLIEEWVLCPFRQFPLIMGWKPFLSLSFFFSLSLHLSFRFCCCLAIAHMASSFTDCPFSFNFNSLSVNTCNVWGMRSEGLQKNRVKVKITFAVYAEEMARQ